MIKNLPPAFSILVMETKKRIVQRKKARHSRTKKLSEVGTFSQAAGTADFSSSGISGPYRSVVSYCSDCANRYARKTLVLPIVN